MLSKLALRAVLAIGVWSMIATASPIESTQDLVTRNNKWNLKCSNAPDVVAGNLVNSSDYLLTTELQFSGSNQRWLKYLWCTVGTKTYTFFGMRELNVKEGMAQPRYRNLYHAFDQARISVSDTIATNGKDGPIDGLFTMRPSNTNIEIGVQSAVGTMTYGVLQSALSGLAEAATNYNPTNPPMLFQINDGEWGELGYGYAGYIDNLGQCVYDITPEITKACSDVTNKWVID